jgi:hypothetical protein
VAAATDSLSRAVRGGGAVEGAGNLAAEGLHGAQGCYTVQARSEGGQQPGVLAAVVAVKTSRSVARERDDNVAPPCSERLIAPCARRSGCQAGPAGQ